MPLQALGYVGFGSSALDDWRQFGTGLVGLQAVERSASQLAFRMDDRKQRIVIDRSIADGERFFVANQIGNIVKVGSRMDNSFGYGPAERRQFAQVDPGPQDAVRLGLDGMHLVHGTTSLTLSCRCLAQR